MPVITRGKKKEDNKVSINTLIRQIDTLQGLSADYRKQVLDLTWFKDMREFYNLAVSPSRSPSFRPSITVPQLQLLSITEASDLADMNPKIYIVNKDKRVKDRETALQAEWRDSFVNNQLMLASIWSMLNGNGYIQLGFDPYAKKGRGQVFARMRDPESVYYDPACTDEDDWHYLILEDRMYPDEIKARWPETGGKAKANPPSDIMPGEQTGQNMFTLQMTAGPMSVPGMNMTGGEVSVGPSDGRLRVRWTYIFDPTVQDIARDTLGRKTEIDKVVPANFELKYPNGRLIIDCEGLENPLYDGDNPNPSRAFGLVRILGMPALGSFQAPPPVRYTRPLQQTAERMFTQVFENAVRLNNGVWFIPEDTGITADDFGGIPGEVRVIGAQSKPPTMVQPKPFPPHMLEYPKYLLGLQKELQGFSPAREGKQGSGNVGVELFDAAVFQSQSMTRMRGKLMAESVARIAQQFFALMAAYYKDAKFPDYTKEFDMVGWDKIDSPESFNLYIDPASIVPISQSALQKLVPVLKKEGLLSARTALELSGIPGASEEASQIEAEQSLNALSRLKKR